MQKSYDRSAEDQAGTVETLLRLISVMVGERGQSGWMHWVDADGLVVNKLYLNVERLLFRER